MNLYWLILLPILFGALYYLLPVRISKYISVVFQVIMVALAFDVFYHVKNYGQLIHNIGNWPDYIGIALRADELALVMVLLTTVLFLGMGLYQLKSNYIDKLLVFLTLVLEGLIIGIFLSNDLFNIFVLIEVSTVIISILIMFKKDSQAIYDGILYLLINVVSMLFFLMGLGILYKTVGVVDFYGVEKGLHNIDNARVLILPYAFIITSISLKVALMPLFSWLPKAHGTPSAPSTISAILSGLYVKSGVYLFIRVQTMFSPQIDTKELFYIMGFMTAVIGFILAMAQKDIKLLLAYSTVSQIGLIMMGINMNSPQAQMGGIYHIINHAFFKSTLFLTAGMIIDVYNTRNVYEIRGVWKRMPYVSVATILAVLGIVGAPFFNGSISKYWIAYGAKDSWAEYGIMLVNLGTVITFVKYTAMLTGFKKVKQAKKENTDILQNSVVIIMGGLCFIGGLFSEFIVEYLFGTELMIDTVSYALKSMAFILTLIIGIVIFKFWLKKSSIPSKLNRFELSFNGICLVITLFFVFMVVYLDFQLPKG
ncbi:proton-conducting membrane transporter [Mobilitalea sibirica]|uniref:Proton-conducting membrane transporter n=1 Tax=Mobilitalea sibirica TaxID=1462919 RepID=A0A8J7H7C9_9FIRM|nr:proton-conducting transporter membrane subunit [Mobilitalea sibirica]MBH1939350.1 proton-conducting membrane transporter [Mobilitalea sibirica]